MRGRNPEDRGRRSEVRGLAVGSAGERGGKMAPGAGRVEPNQRKRAGIRLRQAASARATASEGLLRTSSRARRRDRAGSRGRGARHDESVRWRTGRGKGKSVIGEK